MSHETVVRFCAPTLAGIKVSSLFNCPFTCVAQLHKDVEYQNSVFNHKGIFFKVMRIIGKKALILVYRPFQLAQILANDAIKHFLDQYNYGNCTVKDALEILKQNMERQEFPHEIGIFLGYPLADVMAFIENNGQNEKFVGYWKVYFNEEHAKKLFQQYSRCTKHYCKKFAEGTSVTKLAIAF